MRDWLSLKLYLWSVRLNPSIYDIKIHIDEDDTLHFSARRRVHSEEDRAQFMSYAEYLEVRDDPAVQRAIRRHRDRGA